MHSFIVFPFKTMFTELPLHHHADCENKKTLFTAVRWWLFISWSM